MRALLLSALLVMMAGVAAASGTRNEDGYYVYSGYYYWPTSNDDGSTRWSPYNRKKEYDYSYNYRYPTWKYVYYQAYDAPAYPATAAAAPKSDVSLPVPNDPAWMSKMAELAAFSKKAQVAKDLRAAEHAYFMEASDFFGLKGALTSYEGPGPYGAPPGNILLGPHGQMGNTVFGYNRVQNSQVFGDAALLDYNVGMQQASRHTDAATVSAEKARMGFVDFLKEFGMIEAEKHAQRMELVKAQIVGDMVANTLKPTPRKYVQTRERGYTVQPTMPVPAGTVGRLPLDQFMVMARTHCAACHSGNRLEGGFDIESYPTMTMQDKTKLWNERLFTSDLSKIMPRVQGGGPGPKLPDEVLRQFLLH